MGNLPQLSHFFHLKKQNPIWKTVYQSISHSKSFTDKCEQKSIKFRGFCLDIKLKNAEQGKRVWKASLQTERLNNVQFFKYKILHPGTEPS